MKKILIILIILISLLSPNLVKAQEEENEENLSTTTKYFDISMERVRQSAWNKAVIYTIYVTPKLDSPKTQILWDASSAIDINPRHKEFVDLYQDETYTFNASVKSQKSGNYEISVNLIAWQYDTNYTNSVSDIVTFDANLLAQPVEPSYTYNLIAKYLIILLLFVAGIFGLVVYGKKSLKKLKAWLTPPD